MEVPHLVVCFLLLMGAPSINGGNKYISWDDLAVDDERGGAGESGGSRVIVVDGNGGGDSATVQGAVDMVPHHNAHRFKIHILPGVYSEKVHIPASKPYISFIGDPDQPSATVIRWHDKASDRDEHGAPLGTWKSASVAVESDYFCAAGITFENTEEVVEGGEGNQAVALRIAGDKSVFYKSRFVGWQDTLLDESGTHYFFHCFIQGSVDFIFGNARSLYQGCTVSVVGHAYAVTAQGRESAKENTGFSFVNCTLRGSSNINGGVLLGRAWRDYSRVVFSYCDFDVDVRPEGWDDWGVPSRQKTAVFGEYRCRGRGADRRRRVSWSKHLNRRLAKPYLDIKFISGKSWLKL